MCVVADYHKICKQIQDQIVQLGFNPRALFILLLNTAQFEFLLKEVYYEMYNDVF